MASRSSHGERNQHLDASGSRNIVYCHHCYHEWYEDEYGLECPHCQGIITEIVVPGQDDPRRMSDHGESNIPSHTDDPWTEYSPDSEETNVDEPTSNGPNNSSIIFRSLRTPGPRSPPADQESTESTSGNENRHVLTDFRNMISSLLGPQLRHSAPGRSGPDTLFNEPIIQTSTFRIGGNGSEHSFIGSRIIFTNNFSHDGNTQRPRDTNEPHIRDTSPLDDIATIISNILAPAMIGRSSNLGSADNQDNQAGTLNFQALFAAMTNPRNARFGDAVYSQEALDQILTTLMEQSTTSNAPGPAPSEAIAALPRKKLDSKLLGYEGKSECSICMDEVKLGDEVLVLPCNHWFDEACATAWLKEHNTCPICRKGITVDSSPKSPHSRQGQVNTVTSQNEDRQHRHNTARSIFSRDFRSRNDNRNNTPRDTSVRLNEERSHQLRTPGSLGRDTNVTPMPGSFPAECVDDSEIGTSERIRASRRSSNTRTNSNVGRNSTLHRLRGLHDRLNNNCRNG